MSKHSPNSEVLEVRTTTNAFGGTQGSRKQSFYSFKLAFPLRQFPENEVLLCINLFFFSNNRIIQAQCVCEGERGHTCNRAKEKNMTCRKSCLYNLWKWTVVKGGSKIWSEKTSGNFWDTVYPLWGFISGQSRNRPHSTWTVYKAELLPQEGSPIQFPRNLFSRIVSLAETQKETRHSHC